MEAARVTGVVQLPCPLWLGLDRLHTALAEVMERLGPAPFHTATMTGELADAFPTRIEGVAWIIDALVQATAPARLRFYNGNPDFLDPVEAAAKAESVASANWHATAALAARFVHDALLVDVGSTTTDLVNIAGGDARPEGYNDCQRLACGELVYTGLVRTPVMALCQRVPFWGTWRPLANELFATTADVYRVLGELPEGADQMATADGREKTVEASIVRLARMIGTDVDGIPAQFWRPLAAWLAEAQLRQIADAAHTIFSYTDVPQERPVLGAGVGRHLATRLASRLGRHYQDLTALPPFASAPGAADCAPAVAVALLACSA